MRKNGVWQGLTGSVTDMTAGKKTTKDKDRHTPGIDLLLRADAEEHLVHSPKASIDLSGQTPEELIHELRVHQIELEVQAEDLIRSKIALEESRDKFLDLCDFAPLGYLTLTEKALIADVNLTGATLLGVPRDKLVNTRFRRCVAQEDLEAWYSI